MLGFNLICYNNQVQLIYNEQLGVLDIGVRVALRVTFGLTNCIIYVWKDNRITKRVSTV